MNWLVITMVWGASACRGARVGAFSIFYMKIIKNHEIHGTSMKTCDFMKFHDFDQVYGISRFLCGSGGSKTLIFLRNYWCFCNVMDFMDILIPTESQ